MQRTLNAIFNLRPEIFYMDISKQGSKMADHLPKLQTISGCLQVARQITLFRAQLLPAVDKPFPVNTLIYHFNIYCFVDHLDQKYAESFFFLFFFGSFVLCSPHRAFNSKQQPSCFCPGMLVRTLRIISTPDYKTM